MPDPRPEGYDPAKTKGWTCLGCIFGQHRTRGTRLHDQAQGGPAADDPVDWHSIERVVAGDASPGERAALDRWVGTDEHRRALVARFAAAAQGARHPRYEVDAAWSAVARQMRGARSLPAASAKRGRTATPGDRPDTREWVRNAAAILAAAGVCGIAGAVAWRTVRPVREPTPIAAAAEQPQIVITGRGQRETVQLRDGSRVTLAPDSRLTEPVAFGRSTREVTLDGKAYFDVVHDSLHPFTVVVAGERIRDLGTQFVVDAYTRYPDRGPAATRSQPQMLVAVSTGAVRIEFPPSAANTREGVTAVGEGGATIVRAGEIARVDDRGQTTIVASADIATWTGWTSGALVFNKSSLADVVRELERWYDIDIVISDPALARQRVTATFRDMPISRVLNTLAIAVHARCWWSGHTVTVSPLGAGNEPPL
jgi:transmembrane sensor